MILLNGKELSLEKREALKDQGSKFFCQKWLFSPALLWCLWEKIQQATFMSKNKLKACEAVGIQSIEKRLAADIDEASLLRQVEELNQDQGVHGILVQLPLPKHINEDRVIAQIHPLKDVDGLTVENMGLLFAGKKTSEPLYSQRSYRTFKEVSNSNGRYSCCSHWSQLPLWVNPWLTYC